MIARTGSLKALRAGIRASVAEMVDAADREADKTERLTKAERSNWATLPHEKILPDPDQPRQLFEAEKLRALAESIRTVGLREPLRVCETGLDGRYRIMDGQRRWRAVQLLLDEGLEEHREVVVLVDDLPDTDTRLRVEQLITSVHKEVFVPLETANVLLRLVEGKGQEETISAAKFAQQHGLNAKYVERHLKVVRALSVEERRLLLQQYPEVSLDPLEKLASWLAGPLGASLTAEKRAEALDLFVTKRPPARLVDAVLRPLAGRGKPGRPKSVRFKAGRTSGGGFSVSLTIPPDRAADPGTLDRAERNWSARSRSCVSFVGSTGRRDASTATERGGRRPVSSPLFRQTGADYSFSRSMFCRSGLSTPIKRFQRK